MMSQQAAAGKNNICFNVFAFFILYYIFYTLQSALHVVYLLLL